MESLVCKSLKIPYHKSNTVSCGVCLIGMFLVLYLVRQWLFFHSRTFGKTQNLTSGELDSMRFHDESAEKATKGTYSVYDVVSSTHGQCYVAVPFPFNSNLESAEEFAKTVAGDMNASAERRHYLVPAKRKEALENSKEIFPEYF